MHATQENHSNRAATALTSLSASKFLGFKLGNEEYGIDALIVQEILGFDIMSAPDNVPEFIKGKSTVNLNGMMVPVVDMRPRLRLVSPEYQRYTTVIVLHLSGQIIGMAVDGVTEVMTIGPEQIGRPATNFATRLDSQYVLGIGTVNDRALILVDTAKLMFEADENSDSDAVIPGVVQFLTCLQLRL